MALAVCAANNGDKKNAIDACDEIRTKHVKTPYKDAAGTLREALQKAEPCCLAEPVERVVVHTRTVVLPGASKWHPDFKSLAAPDVILYNIKCVGRDNCTVVKGVRLSLPPDEPQVPPSKGNQMFFVRAPILFIKDLRYDFETLFPSLQKPASKLASNE